MKRVVVGGGGEGAESVGARLLSETFTIRVFETIFFFVCVLPLGIRGSSTVTGSFHVARTLDHFFFVLPLATNSKY